MEIQRDDDRQAILHRALSIQQRRIHPAISDLERLGTDIYQPLFDWFFDLDVFEYWRKDESRWILRCYGGPGTGKTTISNLAVKKIRSQLNRSKEAIASIFLTQIVLENSAAFIEDCMITIFRQLSQQQDAIESDVKVMTDFKLYVEECEVHGRNAVRLRHLRRAVHASIAAFGRVYLIIDDFDRCNEAASLCLEEEIYQMQQLGVKVFLTSRIQCLQGQAMDWFCDSCEAGRLRVYWECQTCDKDPWILCTACQQEIKSCDRCPDDRMFTQPYEFVSVNIGQASEEQMKAYISWNLETNHGDLGLNSGAPNKPPNSKLGRAFLKKQNKDKLEHIVDQIAYQANSNIAMARLRLEIIHGLKSPDDTMAGDRLPRSISALFDAVVRQIERQSQNQREVGLKAIAAMSHFEYDDGVDLAVLQQLLRNSAEESTQLQVLPRSLEDILQATKGFLIAEPHPDRQFQFRAYNEAFHLYARESYNESLLWAHTSLDFDKIEIFRRIKRSHTGFVHSGFKQLPTNADDQVEPRLGKQLRLQRKGTAWI